MAMALGKRVRLRRKVGAFASYGCPFDPLLALVANGGQMFTDDQMSETALKAVEQAQRSRETADLHVRTIVPCFGGKLLVVGGKSVKDNARFDNFVFFRGDTWEFMYNAAEVVKRLDQGIGDPSLLRGLRALFSFGAIAGIIALAMTATIIILVARHPDVHVPDILTNALTTILGFYFGSQVNRPASR